MPRARKGAARRQAKNRWFKAAKGNRGARRTQWGRIKETVIRAGVNATRHRKLLKRDYRRLWITRIGAACRQRGLSEEDAVSLIVNGFAKQVLKELPMEFAVEAQKLLGVSLEGAVG